MSVQKCPSGLWLEKGTQFQKLVCLRLCESRRQPKTIIVWPSRSHTCAKNEVSCRRSICHLWGCLRDSIRLRWSKVITFLVLSLQNHFKTAVLWSGRRKKRRVRGPKHTCSGRARGVENVLFSNVSEKEIHPGSASRKISKSWVGPKVRKWPLARREHVFGNGFFYDFARRVGSQTKSIVGLLV